MYSSTSRLWQASTRCLLGLAKGMCRVPPLSRSYTQGKPTQSIAASPALAFSAQVRYRVFHIWMYFSVLFVEHCFQLKIADFSALFRRLESSEVWTASLAP